MLEHPHRVISLMSRPSCPLDNHSIRRSDCRPFAGAVERNAVQFINRTVQLIPPCCIFIPVVYMARLISPLRIYFVTRASGFLKLLYIPNQTGSQIRIISIV